MVDNTPFARSIAQPTISSSRSLLYQRQIDPDGDDSLACLLRRVPREAVVLELGPATGYLTRYLRESAGCTIDAVEVSPQMAESARPWCRRMVVGNLEGLDLAAALDSSRYDVIVCADVLEHLRDPWSLVRDLGGLLAPGGRLLVSVPNAGYLGLLVELLRGQFRYRDEGLLDRTHLRFFTLDSVREMLEQAGWHVWAADPVPLCLTDSEFRVRLEALSPALKDELLARPDALCYQWVVEARRSPASEPLVLPRTSPEDRFQIRVFWRGEEADFSDARNRLVWGALGREDQIVQLRVPAGQRALALRLSDRVGFMRLREVRLKSESGAIIWEWTASQDRLPVAGRTEIEEAGTEGLWFVTGTSSRLELGIPTDKVGASQIVELRLGSPMSADFLAARAFWTDPQGLPAQLAACRARCEELTIVRAALGDDESAWSSYARIVRLAKKAPRLLSAIDWLAAFRRRLYGRG